MKKLLNTLYITSEDSYLSLDGETILIINGDQKTNIPLINIENIVSFSYKGASPALLGKCAELNKNVSFYTPNGKFLASTWKPENGNVYLRTEQYRIADDERALRYAKNMICGKLHNQKYLLCSFKNSHPNSIDGEKFEQAIKNMQTCIKELSTATNIDTVRGLEGNASAEYFKCFNDMILRNKDVFFFDGRNRRPPTDNVNALLSFIYAILSNECGAALHSVGIDPYVGFMHTLRPGRQSLALDLVEEFRACLADRFVLTLINNRMVKADDFIKQESGAVTITDEARKVILGEWQKRKREEITHPFLREKIPWGLAPYVQSLLMARTIRGDLDQYPPFLWK